MNSFKLDHFDYALNPDQIAQYPLKNRSDSKMLHYKQGKINHLKITDFVDLLHQGDTVIINHSKTIKARLLAKRPTGAKVELLFQSASSEHHFSAISKSNRALKVRDTLIVEKENQSNGNSSTCQLEVMEKLADGSVEMKSNLPVAELIDHFGHVPLPPYITRSDQAIDVNRYQTVYAKQGQSIAAPTAGLHFDKALIEAIEKKGVNWVELCLDVGSGTFRPVKTKDIRDHQMHHEHYQISEQSAEQLNQAIANKSRLIAVGSTSTRAIESNFLQHQKIKSGQFKTNLFIRPGFQFQVIGAMLTNFHIPKSTLVMMVATFMGYDAWKIAYQQALIHHYRFLSYGDCMFIEPN